MNLTLISNDWYSGTSFWQQCVWINRKKQIKLDYFSLHLKETIFKETNHPINHFDVTVLDLCILIKSCEYNDVHSMRTNFSEQSKLNCRKILILVLSRNANVNNIHSSTVRANPAAMNYYTTMNAATYAPMRQHPAMALYPTSIQNNTIGLSPMQRRGRSPFRKNLQPVKQVMKFYFLCFDTFHKLLIVYNLFEFVLMHNH